AEGRNRHVKRLVAFRDWARALDLPDHRITFHVLEAPDIAEAPVERARGNAIAHPIMGSLGMAGVRWLLGRVFARVAPETDCTIPVVRSRRAVTEAGGSDAMHGAAPD